MDTILQNIYEAIIDGNSAIVRESIQKAIENNTDPEVILNQAMIASMAEVGQRFERGDFFVPEMLVAARAMQNGLLILKPYLKENNVKSAGKVAIGTVKGDLHDIGKNLVSLMLEGSGFEVVDLGVDVDPSAFLKTVKGGIQVIAMSALLTTTMNNMATTLEVLKEAGVRKQVKVIIGGAPVTEEYALRIGADAYAPDASSAVRTVRDLFGT